MNMFRTYFNILVLINLMFWTINGQESDLNVTQTTPTTSVKPTSDYPYQTTGFNDVGVKSGPILVIDKKTIFISDLHYDGLNRSAHFWAGMGLPSSNGTLVPNENNSNDSLKAYSGYNIYLQLPGNLTTDTIDYLGIWSKEKNSVISYVVLYANTSDEVKKNIPKAFGYHNKTVNNNIIFRVPKCCALNEILINRKCAPTTKKAKFEYEVFESNETHIDPDTFKSNIKFVPYVRKLACPENYSLVALDPEMATFGFIYNTSLIYGEKDASGILSHGKFCMENIIDQEKATILICEQDFSNDTIDASMLNLYFPLLVISTLCFFASALCYLFILKAKDVHRQCFIGYSLSMTVTFLSLIFLQKLNSACEFIGSLFIFSTLCSFAWLTCLCIDLIFLIKPDKRFSDQKRIYSYIGASLGIPIIFLAASLIPDGHPDVPKSFTKIMYTESHKMCKFEEPNVPLFFTPIGLLIMASLSALGYTSYIINEKDSNDFEWVRNKSNYKFMFIQCMMIFIISAFYFTLELIINLVDISEYANGFLFSLVIIEYMQGIFVFIVLSGHNCGRKYIEKRKCKRKNVPPFPIDNHEMRPLGSNGYNDEI